MRLFDRPRCARNGLDNARRRGSERDHAFYPAVAPGAVAAARTRTGVIQRPPLTRRRFATQPESSGASRERQLSARRAGAFVHARITRFGSGPHAQRRRPGASARSTGTRDPRLL